MLAMALALNAVAASNAIAQSASNGRALYGFYCQACHTADPNSAIAPFNLIMTAAANPAQITVASNSYPSQMGFINSALTLSDKSDIAAYLATFLASPAIVPVVEFYNASQDHYFISASAAEISDLDHGIHPGWVRTGLTFNAYPTVANGTNPVCRFYIPPSYGDSHFYSASPTECAEVQAKFPAFLFEAPDVFYIAIPDTTTGVCPAGTAPVYRVWDDRIDTNHRYTTSLQVRQQMVTAGWLAEGYGPTMVIMCSPT